MMHEKKAEPANTFSVEKRKKLDWREVISLKHSAEEVWDTETLNTKRDWGKLLHYTLAEIHYANQTEEVIAQLFKSGKFDKDDLKKLTESVNNLLNEEKVKTYFSDNWIVKTEKEILMENGKTYIPDRLLFSKITDEVVVIDYKTGLEKDAHENQITEYANALSKMGKKNIKRILIYISDEIKIKEL